MFCPETDEPVLEIWLRSLRHVARVAFGCKLEEPRKVCCSDQRGELQSKIVVVGSLALIRIRIRLMSDPDTNMILDATALGFVTELDLASKPSRAL